MLLQPAVARARGAPSESDARMRTSAAARAKTAANEQQIVQIFRVARAVTLRTARSLSDLGLNNSRALQHLVTVAILRRAGPERYFLDETAWAGRRSA